LKPWEEVDILSEVSIMSKLSHPNIVQLIDFFIQPDCYLIVMEFCEGGDLFDRLGRRVESIKGQNGNTNTNIIGYSERDARDLCAVLLEAVRYCHEDMRIAHCDLKPRNLLLQVSVHLDWRSFSSFTKVALFYFTHYYTCLLTP
jgi:serine/threonine protein kinase